MISNKYRCIFVHIPKTGGSSIEKIIWSPAERTIENLWMGFIKPHYNKYQTGGLQHLFASHIAQEVSAECFNSYYKFSMIRNPFDKIISQYKYMSSRSDLRDFIGMQEPDSFAQYLDLIAKKKHVQWDQQYKFIVDEHGELMVNDILRFENFNNEVSALFNRLKIPFNNIPHENKSSQRKKTTSYYCKETYQQVAEMYSADFKRFNYPVLPFEQFLKH